MSLLTTSYPNTLTLAEIVGDKLSNGAAVTSPLADVIARMVALGQAEISVEPLRAGASTQARPEVWRVARLEAAEKQPWLTTLAHKSIPRKPILGALVPHINGENDRDQLIELVCAELARGEAPRRAVEDEIGGQGRDFVAAFVDRCLSYLSRNALIT